MNTLCSTNTVQTDHQQQKAQLVAEMDELIDLMTQVAYNRGSIKQMKQHQQRFDALLNALEALNIELLFDADNNHKKLA